MKLFVFDIDNTLIKHCDGKSYLPDSAREALQLIKASGNKIIIATGRTYNVTEHIMRDLQVSDAVICNGSAMVLNNNLVYNEPIRQEPLAHFLTEIKNKRLPALAFDSHDIYIHNDIDDKEYFTKIVKSFIDPMYEGTSHQMKQFDFNIQYNSISIFDAEEINPYSDISCTWYEEGGYELMNKNSTKASGILKYINDNGIDKQNVYVFGDNYNDIPMFEMFYENSYVVGDACDIVKSYAKNVCDLIEEDGIYKAVIKILNM